MTGTSDSNYTQQDPEDGASEFALAQLKITQTLARVRTIVLVQVKSVTGGGGAIAKPPTVSVQPLVKIVDGNNTASSHGTIQNIPVFRYGSGNGVVICDPVVGDVGFLAVADRDSSVVIKTGNESQPGSRRKFNMSDGVYLGSILSAVPKQYLTFSSTGLKLADNNGNVLEMKAGGNFFTGPIIGQTLQLSGSIEAVGGGVYTGDFHTAGTVIAGFGTGDQVGLKTHIHPYTGPSSGGVGEVGNPPTPGT